MSKILMPKSRIAVIEPLIFLAGPIRGAPHWQDNAIGYLLSKNPDIAIANPRRSLDEQYAPLVQQGDEWFSRQRAWERHYLDIASRSGAILFWLPGESEHDCKKSYGAMTRLELGQWTTRCSMDASLRMCVGSDGKFSELDTILYDLSLDLPTLKVLDSLEATCDEALRLAK